MIVDDLSVVHPNCRQHFREAVQPQEPFPGRKGCHPLIILRLWFLEADLPCIPTTTVAGKRLDAAESREAVPRPIEIPQRHFLSPGPWKTQSSRASGCRSSRFPKANFSFSSIMKCPSTDGPQLPSETPLHENTHELQIPYFWKP